ncbi:E3 SUMO-protein ligase ZBED1-like [Haematobia irritans]|uniref:E3 SUMO-protein ligase ZBED1-like n=1 Tax=Haematobia irritans TaxID=7368 RepID=UPI003F50ADE2
MKLKQDVITRWNSTYEMLQRIYFMKDAVITTLSLIRPDLSLSFQDWDLIKEVIPILEPFYEITVEISAEKNVTLSKVMILNNLLEWSINNSTSTNENIMRMINVIEAELNSRFGEYERNCLYADGSLTDPRFKRRAFKTDSAYQTAIKQLRDRINRIKLQNIDDGNDTIELEVPKTSSSKVWSYYDTNFANVSCPENNTAAAIKEFDKYLNEDCIERTADPLSW